ncbi:MAG TPA: histidine kinase dimerization/phospho-acceptor domain-containing protein, partial [Phototrophicaceae bacterium]|nr:histidine kinase dimerization/phospho-acceptor domain-containing protein [Phototrophicaceae bacterium]
ILGLVLVWCAFLIWSLATTRQLQKQAKIREQETSQSRAEVQRLRTKLEQAHAQARQFQTQIERLQRLEASLPANLHHDFRSPIRVINGFCETLLAPRHELPAAFRGDIEAIQRSAQRLREITESVLAALDTEALGLRPVAGWAAAPVTITTAPKPATKIGVLGASPAVLSLFQRHFEQTVIGVSTAAIGELDLEGISAVILTDEAQTSHLSDLRRQLPVLVCPLYSVRDAAIRQPISNSEQLFTAETLVAALERLGRPIREVLVIDENASRVDQLSEYCAALTPPINLWKAYSGREGLALLHEQPMDAVIFDLSLTDVDGLMVVHTAQGGTNQPTLLAAGAQEFAVVAPPVWSEITLYGPHGYNGLELVAQLETMAVNLKREADLG